MNEPIVLRVNGYQLATDDGKPFFWLADTAWNLWCRGTPEEWDEYLAVRKRQGFSVIQFVAGWWRGCTQPIHGRPFDVVDGSIVHNEAAWQSLDLVFAKIRAAGLVAAPIMIWTLTEIDPGRVYSEAQVIEIARRQYARWNAPDVVWLLGGDGRYTEPESEARWKRIGRAVFAPESAAGGAAQIATLHPCGVSWIGGSFACEPWYDIVGIQSGHGSQDDDLRFLVNGDYAQAWRSIEKPFINLEPNYEDARSYHVRKHLTAYHVRRAAYWSLLVAPPAGVTYGIGSVWIWSHTMNEIAENHDESWIGNPWNSELASPGAVSMTQLRLFFESINWTQLRPTPELLLAQPGRCDLEEWQAVAATTDGRCLVAYLPRGGRIALRTTAGPWRLAAGLAVYSVDPADGRRERIGTTTDALCQTFECPAGEQCDRLVLVE